MIKSAWKHSLMVFVRPVKRSGWLGDKPIPCQKCGLDCTAVHGNLNLDIGCEKI